MERPTAVFPLCAHIKGDGAQCQSAALKGLRFCYHHIGGKIPTQRATSTSGPEARLDLAYPDSREAIQHNLHLVAEALSDGRIDTALANTYNRIYRTAEQNLHRWERAQEKARKPSLQMPSLSSDIHPTEPEEPEGAPCLEETWDRQSTQPPTDDVHPTEEPTPSPEPCALSPVFDPGAPCLEETWDRQSAQPPTDDVHPTEEPTPSPEPCTQSPVFEPEEPTLNPEPCTQSPVFDPRDIDWEKYADRFRELERRYMNSPDFADRIKAAGEEFIAIEQAAHNAKSQNTKSNTTN